MLYIRLISFLLLAFLIGGCAHSGEITKPEQEEVIYPEPDPEIENRLSSYRPRLEKEMGGRIAHVTDTLRFGQPESPLGNLVADALRFRAAGELRKFVHLGIIGQDSFRLYFEPGPLTLGDVYEFMPYENHLVVLTLSGEKVKELCAQVAEAGGAPVSGMRFRLTEGRATGVLINAEVIDPEREYLVATSNYLADGGDRFPALWEPLYRYDLDISIRELYIDYFRNKRELEPVTDGRIRE